MSPVGPETVSLTSSQVVVLQVLLVCGPQCEELGCGSVSESPVSGSRSSEPKITFAHNFEGIVYSLIPEVVLNSVFVS